MREKEGESLANCCWGVGGRHREEKFQFILMSKVELTSTIQKTKTIRCYKQFLYRKFSYRLGIERYRIEFKNATAVQF